MRTIKEIKLDDGNSVLLSDIDYPFIKSLYNIYVDSHGYVKCKSKFKRILLLETGSLHRVIMQPPKQGRKVVVDHINGNKLDNRRENLRIASQQENMFNRKPQMLHKGKDVTSKYKGVYFSDSNNNWTVSINIDGKKVKVGIFDNELAAANCYNYYSLKHHKEFAHINECDYMDISEWMKYKRGNNYSSKFRGVSYSKTDEKWLSQICFNYNRERIGSYDTEIEAAIAYNKRAKELLGEKAKLNKIVTFY